MIRSVKIENFKSVQNAELKLGRFNVLIGENGSGKSNLLEAIGYAGLAVDGKLSHEFLTARGIRSPEPKFVSSAFEKSGPFQPSEFEIRDGRGPEEVIIRADTTPPIELKHNELVALEDEGQDPESQLQQIQRIAEEIRSLTDRQRKRRLAQTRKRYRQHLHQEQLEQALSRFLIYSPENSALRQFQPEGQVLPLGVNGEGLFAHLKSLHSTEETRARVKELQEHVGLLDWFAGFHIPELSFGEQRLAIKDRYLPDGVVLDQRSANEGFLFLLFYFTLFISPKTPSFFAIDNIDASLNPKLCARLIKDLIGLSEKYDKQVIVTTHNPAILDGLDLNDDEQRLLVVTRNSTGETRVRRIKASKPVGDRPVVPLSQAFTQGYLGGLPRNF